MNTCVCLFIFYNYIIIAHAFCQLKYSVCQGAKTYFAAIFFSPFETIFSHRAKTIKHKKHDFESNFTKSIIFAVCL